MGHLTKKESKKCWMNKDALDVEEEDTKRQIVDQRNHVKTAEKKVTSTYYVSTIVKRNQLLNHLPNLEKDSTMSNERKQVGMGLIVNQSEPKPTELSQPQATTMKKSPC